MKVLCQHDWFLVKTPFLACRQLPFSVSSHDGERMRVSSWCLFLSRHYSPQEGPILLTSSNPNYFLKALFPKLIKIEIRVSTYKFWEDTYIQSISRSIFFFFLGLYSDCCITASSLPLVLLLSFPIDTHSRGVIVYPSH